MRSTIGDIIGACEFGVIRATHTAISIENRVVVRIESGHANQAGLPRADIDKQPHHNGHRSIRARTADPRIQLISGRRCTEHVSTKVCNLGGLSQVPIRATHCRCSAQT